MSKAGQERWAVAVIAQGLVREAGWQSSCRLNADGFDLLVRVGDDVRAIVEVGVAGNDSFDVHLPNDCSFHETEYDPAGYRATLEQLIARLVAADNANRSGAWREVESRVLWCTQSGLALDLADGEWIGLRTGLSFQDRLSQLLSSTVGWLDDTTSGSVVGRPDRTGSSDQEWFRREPGQPVDTDLTVFWNRLRDVAAGWPDLGVRPADSWFTGGFAGLELPGLTCRTRQLHLDHSVDRHGPKLKGEWAATYHFDADDCDAALLVRGIDLTPTQLADIGSQWIEQHLRMPIVRQEWTSTADTGEPTVDRRRWLDNQGRLIDDDAGLPLRLTKPRRPPDREISERPDRRPM